MKWRHHQLDTLVAHSTHTGREKDGYDTAAAGHTQTGDDTSAIRVQRCTQDQTADLHTGGEGRRVPSFSREGAPHITHNT